MNKCAWAISSTETVEFEIYDNNLGWNKAPGVYIFSYQAASGVWLPLYVGQTDDFSARLPSHEKLDRAIHLGATHIHARVVYQQPWRDQIERYMIQQYQPPLNQQMKGGLLS